MTCVIGMLTHTGRYMLGADSYQGSRNLERTKDLPNSKIVRNGQLLFGCCGRASIATTLEFDKPLGAIVVPKRCSKKTIHNIVGYKIMPRLKRIFAASITTDEMSLGELLLATGKHLFHIQLDRGFYWGRVCPVFAIGTGSEYALGSLYTSLAGKSSRQLEHFNQRRVLTRALEAAERFCPSVRGPFVFDET